MIDVFFIGLATLWFLVLFKLFLPAFKTANSVSCWCTFLTCNLLAFVYFLTLDLMYSSKCEPDVLNVTQEFSCLKSLGILLSAGALGVAASLGIVKLIKIGNKHRELMNSFRLSQETCQEIPDINHQVLYAARSQPQRNSHRSPMNEDAPPDYVTVVTVMDN